MKYLKRFNENNDDMDETMKIVAEQLFYELEDRFSDRFLPIKVILKEPSRKTSTGNVYYITVCFGLGWITRFSNEERDELDDMFSDITIRYNNKIYISMAGDSYGGGKSLYEAQNDSFPKSPDDYIDMPQGRYPENDDDDYFEDDHEIHR